MITNMKNEKKMKEPNLTRSATAPETMVAAVPAKTSWKKNFAQSGTPVQLSAEYTPLYASPVAGLPSAPPRNQSPCVPNSGVPSPNMMPKPTARKAIDETANTTKFFARIVTVFLARQKPDSTAAKPRFMKKTRNAAASTHTVSMATLASAAFASSVSSGSTGLSCASAAPPAASKPPTASARSTLRPCLVMSRSSLSSLEEGNGAASGAIGRGPRRRRRERFRGEQATCRGAASPHREPRRLLTPVPAAGPGGARCPARQQPPAAAHPGG